MKFEQFSFRKEILKALSTNKMIDATPIQEEIIPVIVEGKDVIGQSHTGSGKTLAFLLPILQQIDITIKSPQYLIICPTRELAAQVMTQVRIYSKFLEGVTTTLVCGGSQIRNQIFSLKRTNIVVGTPGRIVDHLKRKTLKTNYLKMIVLDEADEILKMGFKAEIDFIFQNIRNPHQTLLFSATISKEIEHIASTYQNEPQLVKIQDNEQLKNSIEQYFLYVEHKNKETAFIKLITNLKPKLSIIFCNTKSLTEHLTQMLLQNHLRVGVLNGDKKQGERNRVMTKFRNNWINILISTDVAARGIDVSGIDYIFNYDLPNNQEIYVHRIGRTARAGALGSSFTMISNRSEFMQLKGIEKYQNKKINPYEGNEVKEYIVSKTSFNPNDIRGSENNSFKRRKTTFKRNYHEGNSWDQKNDFESKLRKINFQGNSNALNNKKRPFSSKKTKKSYDQPKFK